MLLHILAHIKAEHSVLVAEHRLCQSFAQLIDLDPSGYAIASENCRTKVPGIFVAGDNRVKEVRQLVTAASDGAVAATEAVKYLAAL